MRHAPIEFARQIRALREKGQQWDAIVCTDMLDLATLKGLCGPLPPTMLYFHENQFAYPNQAESEQDHHYAFTNLLSALAADAVWFNSEFNRRSMFDGIHQLADRLPDYSPADQVEVIAKKSTVQYLGVDVSVGDGKLAFDSGPLQILWAARWEHDKGPEILEEILQRLFAVSEDFEISIVGQQFRKQPAEFDSIKSRFDSKIKHWGFLERSQYDQALQESHIFLSTAHHEFFGLSFAEAVCNNTFPIVPNRLAYPELLMPLPHGSEQMLYDSTEHAVELLLELSRDRERLEKMAVDAGSHFRNQFNWPSRARAMDRLLVESLRI